MAMTQDCIRRHYETAWKTASDAATDLSQIAYSSPIEDAVLYPVYRRMVGDFKLKVTGGEVLDVGSGSGRWIRFFTEFFAPALLMGADYTQSSVDLLKKWFAPGSHPSTRLEFRQADIGAADLELGARFDLINIANVLFHIPEEGLFINALNNLARHLKPGGMIVTTEYLPRTTLRTQWMLVRDRYHFEKRIREAGLRISAVEAFGVFANDPMGIDGRDDGVRGRFARVRSLFSALAGSQNDDRTTRFMIDFLTEIEQAVLGFCRERIADIDMPSQKLVFLARD